MIKSVFTCGNVNGIGPEICIKTFNDIYDPLNYKIIFCCPGNVFEDISSVIKPNFEYRISRKPKEEYLADDSVLVIDSGKVKVEKGIPTRSSGKISYKSILNAFQIVHELKADNLITAPVSKIALKKAGVKFPGHTEMLASWSKTKKFTMMFLSNNFKCALVTIHESIKKVPKLITASKLHSVIEVVHDSLRKDFQIKEAKIAVLGLNPHAGENGKMGSKEKKIIEPVIRSFNDPNLQGPFVSDAFFGNQKYKEYDAVVGMYHDQVLIPFKMLAFEEGVNYTAGIPIIRTSPDHGTAFDIAWQNKASNNSMLQAFKWAEQISNNRKRLN